MSIRKKIFSCLVVVSLATTIVSCTSATSPIETTKAPYVSTWKEPAQKFIAPLTGEIISGSAQLQNPAVSVKIPNDTYGARPQIELNQADIVYEELVEGGITRFVAVYHSNQPKEVGPVRSIRPMDPNIIAPYGGIVAYSGGQSEFVKLIKNTGLKNITENDTVMSRTKTRTAPSNLVLDVSKAIAENATLPAPEQQFAYSEDLLSSSAMKYGSKYSKASMSFSDSSSRTWEYSDSDQKWLRFQDNQAHTQSDGAQVSADNLLVLRVNVNYSKYAKLSGKPPFTELFGSGEVWLGTGSNMIYGTWEKGLDPAAPLILKDENGLPLRLAPGRTWIELVPTDKSQGSFKNQ